MSGGSLGAAIMSFAPHRAGGALGLGHGVGGGKHPTAEPRGLAGVDEQRLALQFRSHGNGAFPHFQRRIAVVADFDVVLRTAHRPTGRRGSSTTRGSLPVSLSNMACSFPRSSDRITPGVPSESLTSVAAKISNRAR